MSPPTLEDRTIVSDDTNGSAKKRKMSVSQHTYGHYYKDMNTSMVKSKFLSNPEDLGVVAVGFSGGQVISLYSLSASPFCIPLNH